MFHADRNSDPISRLVYELSKLPGVGEKSATRLAYCILSKEPSFAENLSSAILEAKQKIGFCNQCFAFTDLKVCKICLNPHRDTGVLYVVEKPSDVFSIEKATPPRGMYHVLHGLLSPLDGIGPDQLKVRELLHRVQSSEIKQPVREIILALNPSVEGETTSLYLTRLFRPMGLKITKLAYGIPMGGSIEFTDRQTLEKALENRMEIN